MTGAGGYHEMEACPFCRAHRLRAHGTSMLCGEYCMLLGAGVQHKQGLAQKSPHFYGQVALAACPRVET